MKSFFKKMLFSLVLATSFSFSGNVVFAAPYSCNGSILPNVVICGRSKGTVCDEGGRDMSKQCTVADFTEVLGRVLLFMITLLLVLTPLFIMFLGLKLMIYGKISEKKADIKKQIYAGLFYIIIILGSWLIIKSIIDTLGVRSDIPQFLLDKNGDKIQVGKPRN